MRQPWSVLLSGVVLFSTTTASAQKADAPLPLKRVRLYETGVGYFERGGKLNPNGSVELPVPAGHLDDALKTLVVLSDDGKTNVSGIDFGSSVSRSMARALAGLPSGSEAPIRYLELMKSLKGAPVELKTKEAAFTGRIVDVLDGAHSDSEACLPGIRAEAVRSAAAEPPRDAPCVLKKNMSVLLLTKNAEIRRFAAPEIVSVRPTDKAFRARLGSALDALSTRGSQTRRHLRVLASAQKPVSLGYVAETPLWRSTYRLVLDPAADTAAIQGWALVHNDTDEDWKKVDVELVNGRPDSFLFPLAAPRYARRELVTPEQELSTVPQLLDTTVDNMWSVEIGESFGAGGLGLSGKGSGGGGAGYGVGLGRIGTVGHGGGGPSSSSMLSVGNLANVAKADGVEAGALFRYSLENQVDLRARGSALVPFLQETIAARRIAFFSAPGEGARSAVRLENVTKQTLPAGPIAIYGDGGFSGESGLDRMKPTETRIVHFGFDLDVELGRHASRQEHASKLLTFDGGALVEHFIRRHTVSYDITNRSGSARTVYLALPFVHNSSVEGADELDFDHATGRPAAVFEIAAKKQEIRTLKVDEGLSRRVALEDLTSRTLGKMARSKELPVSQRDVLRRATDRLKEAEVRRGGMKRRAHDLRQVDKDIERLRDHLKAIGSRSSAGRELVARLLASEDEAKKLRRRLDALEREAEEKVNHAKATLTRLKLLAKVEK